MVPMSHFSLNLFVGFNMLPWLNSWQNNHHLSYVAAVEMQVRSGFTIQKRTMLCWTEQQLKVSWKVVPFPYTSANHYGALEWNIVPTAVDCNDCGAKCNYIFLFWIIYFFLPTDAETDTLSTTVTCLTLSTKHFPLSRVYVYGALTCSGRASGRRVNIWKGRA